MNWKDGVPGRPSADKDVAMSILSVNDSERNHRHDHTHHLDDGPGECPTAELAYRRGFAHAVEFLYRAARQPDAAYRRRVQDWRDDARLYGKVRPIMPPMPAMEGGAA